MDAKAEQGREQSYQWLLRALGAYLDEESSCRITLAEVEDGFVVRLQRYLHKMEPLVFRLERATLQQELDRRMQQRNPSRPPARHQGVWAHFPNGHQDFFRALGYELDEAGARGILIDELEDSVVVTYRREDDGEGAEKQMTVLSEDKIEEILNTAFERRRQGQSTAQTASAGNHAE
jgi:hypothetical protein